MPGRRLHTKTPARLLIALVLVCQACAADRTAERALERQRRVAELLESYEKRDYWELQARLAAASEIESPRVRLLRAEVAHALNDPARSNERLAELEAAEAELPDDLRVRARLLRFRNHLRLFEYGAALEAGRALSATSVVDSAIRADVQNETRAMQAVADVPPQRVLSREASEIRRRPDTRLPVQIGDSLRGYVLDTGANLSVMIRSEAAALGLSIREAGVEVGTSTGARVRADLTVAPRVRLGDIELAHVVFLVVPDEVLTFGPEFRIPGIIGFPVINALGEVQFAPGGVVRIPEPVPQRTTHNLALDYLTPLVHVGVLGDEAVCELDTGANTTSLHLPFFDRHRSRIRSEGRIDTFRTAGAGGERRIRGYLLHGVRIQLGDTAAYLPELPVYTESVSSDRGAGADCRLGLDVLATFDGYLLNFRSMAFLPL